MLAEDVDPRFDPRFQRGYDPVRHEATAAPPPDVVTTPEAEPIPQIPQRESEDDVTETDEVAELPVIRRRDPFATVLPILGVVCLAAAGWLAWRYVEVMTINWSGKYVGDGDENAWIQFTGPAFTTGLLAAGAFAIIGWLALRSLRRRG